MSETKTSAELKPIPIDNLDFKATSKLAYDAFGANREKLLEILF